MQYMVILIAQISQFMIHEVCIVQDHPTEVALEGTDGMGQEVTEHYI